MKRSNLILWTLLFLSGMAMAQEHKMYSVYSNQTELKASRSVTLTDGFHIPAGGIARIYTTGVSFQNCQPLTGIALGKQ